MWNVVKRFAVQFVLPAAVATAAHAFSRLVIDELVEQRKAARQARAKPSAKRRRKARPKR